MRLREFALLAGFLTGVQGCAGSAPEPRFSNPSVDEPATEVLREEKTKLKNRLNLELRVNLLKVIKKCIGNLL
mgnify:CR=1 FL=1